MWSSGGHTPFTMHSVFLLDAARRRGCSVLWNPHWASFPRREWQKVNPWCLFVIISAWSHAPLSQLGTAIQPPSRAGLQCSWVPHLGLENSLSSFRPLGHEDYGSILFGKSRICLVDWCPPVGLQRCHSTSSFCFAEDMRGVVPETLKSEEDPCRAVLHLLLKHFNLLPVFSPPTCLSCTCLFPFLLCVHVLTLPHPVGSQHHATPKLNSWHEGESS